MIRRLVVPLAAVVSAFLFSAFGALDSDRLVYTSLTFQNTLDFRIGDDVVFLLLLETEAGRPITAQDIDIFLDGAFIATVETDALGAARFRPERTFAPGSYIISATYRGFQFFRSASVVSAFSVEPAEIVVQTVPVIAGLAFSLEGEVERTGPDGIARFSVDHPGQYSLELQPDQAILAQTDAEFKRWWPGGWELETTVFVPGDLWVQAGFELSFPAHFSFVDPGGDPVEGALIESAVLRGSDGSVHTFSAGETLQLRSNRILARLAGLDSVTVVHSVQSVIVDGVEVVNRGQQRFTFSPELSIVIELLFYDVRFFSRDLLLGLPIGSELELVYPDGERVRYPLDESGELIVTDLARGEYEARLVTRAGLAPSFPIVLSRDQDVRLPVVSFVDILAGAAAAAVVAIGLPLIGRRRRILAFLRRSFQPRAKVERA